MLLILVLGGVISLGDIFSVIFYVIIGLLALVLIGGVLFRAKIRRMQREAEQQGRSWTGYHPFEQRGNKSSREGDVELKRTSARKAKTVSRTVGEYVDFEDVAATKNESSTKDSNQ